MFTVKIQGRNYTSSYHTITIGSLVEKQNTIFLNKWYLKRNERCGENIRHLIVFLEVQFVLLHINHAVVHKRK